jgi:hypothetical protein
VSAAAGDENFHGIILAVPRVWIAVHVLRMEIDFCTRK